MATNEIQNDMRNFEIVNQTAASKCSVRLLCVCFCCCWNMSAQGINLFCLPELCAAASPNHDDDDDDADDDVRQ